MLYAQPLNSDCLCPSGLRIGEAGQQKLQWSFCRRTLLRRAAE
jgi:hypothetical protein